MPMEQNTATNLGVNTNTINNQQYSSVAHTGNGLFVVTWHSYGQDGDSNGIYAQRYNADGTKYGNEFRVNTNTTNFQGYPSIAAHNGKFVVTWGSNGQDGSNYGIYAQRYTFHRNAFCSLCEAGSANVAGDDPTLGVKTNCDVCPTNAAPNADKSVCVCNDGHSFSGSQCSACSAGTYRAGEIVSMGMQRPVKLVLGASTQNHPVPHRALPVRKGTKLFHWTLRRVELDASLVTRHKSLMQMVRTRHVLQRKDHTVTKASTFKGMTT